MSDKYMTLVDLINAYGGGALTAMAGAVLGRMMWHNNEVRKGNRKFFGVELVWELPTAIGMAIIGEGLGSYLDLSQTATTGLIAVLAYMGPRGMEVMLQKWFAKKTGG